MSTWESHWQAGHTPWDAGDSSPTLKRLVDGDALPRGRALVPGAGSGYDVITLARHGREAVGLDLAPSAAPRFERLRDEAGLPRDRARLLIRDFFEYDPEKPFDLVWDYTFLCAIDPEMRGAWVERMDRVLGPNGVLFTLLFPVVPGKPEDDGPPYPLDPDRVRSWLRPVFEPVLLEPVASSHPGREGKEWLGRWQRSGR